MKSLVGTCTLALVCPTLASADPTDDASAPTVYRDGGMTARLGSAMGFLADGPAARH